MNVQQIREAIKGFTRDYADWREPEIWNIQSTFQTRWDLEARDLTGMISSCLSNDHTHRYWSREAWQPREVLLAFTAMEPLMVHAMFHDLFREDRDLVGRIDRFRYHAGELLAEYREKGLRPVVAHHDQDLPIITFYLAMRFPARHVPYDPAALRSTLTRLNARDPQVAVEDPERMDKVAKTLTTFLLQEDQLMTLVTDLGLNLLRPEGTNLLLARDLMHWMKDQG